MNLFNQSPYRTNNYNAFTSSYDPFKYLLFPENTYMPNSKGLPDSPIVMYGKNKSKSYFKDLLMSPNVIHPGDEKIPFMPQHLPPKNIFKDQSGSLRLKTQNRQIPRIS